jgi:replicative DNA helicase
MRNLPPSPDQSDPANIAPLTLEPIPVPEGVQESPPLLSMSSLLDALEEDASKRYEARVTGVPFGPVPNLPSLAAEWGGWIPNGMHVLLGGTGVGKTAFGLQLAAECGCPALYVTCEMTPLELLRRTAARVTRTYLGKFKDGTLSGLDVRAYAQRAARSAPGLVFADGTLRYASPVWIKSAAEMVRGSSPHVLIVVDSLHAWAESAGSDAAEYDLVSSACRELRVLAAQLECPVLVIAEQNRATGQGTGKDKTSSGAGSRKIEYGSESVLYLDREGELNTNREQPIVASFGKNRHGGAGKKLRLLFSGGFQSFREE